MKIEPFNIQIERFDETILLTKFISFLLIGDGPIFPSLMDQSGLTRADLVDEKPNLNDSRDPMTNKYSCTRCGRSYLHQATLVRHQRYECGISASYPCQLCGRKFKRRDVLKGHMEKCINKSNGGPSPIVVSSTGASTPLTSMTVPNVPHIPNMLAITSIANMPAAMASLPGSP